MNALKFLFYLLLILLSSYPPLAGLYARHNALRPTGKIMEKAAEVEFYLQIYYAKEAIAKAHGVVIGESIGTEKSAALQRQLDRIKEQIDNLGRVIEFSRSPLPEALSQGEREQKGRAFPLPLGEG